MPRVYEHMIREPVGNCDPRPAICVHPDTQVADAIALMKQHSCGCVLVQAGDRLLGIFTERDVLLRVAGAGLDTRRTAVSSVMTPDPETLTMRDELAWVLNLMAVGGMLAMVAGPAGRSKGKLRSCCGSCDPGCDCCCEGCCDGICDACNCCESCGGCCECGSCDC